MKLTKAERRVLARAKRIVASWPAWKRAVRATDCGDGQP